MNAYFGPLSRDYCVYFYFMAMFFFVMIILSLIGVVSAIVYQPKKFNMMFIVHAVMLMFNAVLAYYVNRLLHTMCLNSTH